MLHIYTYIIIGKKSRHYSLNDVIQFNLLYSKYDFNLFESVQMSQRIWRILLGKQMGNIKLIYLITTANI